MLISRNYSVSFTLLVCIFGSVHSVSFVKSMMTKDYNEMYQQCIEREGGVRNWSIGACSNIVISEVLVKIEDRVQVMIQTDNDGIEMAYEQIKSYDKERKESFVLAIDDFQESIVQVCRFLGYHLGGPAGPICTMNLLEDLLGMLERWD